MSIMMTTLTSSCSTKCLLQDRCRHYMPVTMSSCHSSCRHCHIHYTERCPVTFIHFQCNMPMTFMSSLQTLFVTWGVIVKEIASIRMNDHGILRTFPRAANEVIQTQLCHRQHLMHRYATIRDNILMQLGTPKATSKIAT